MEEFEISKLKLCKEKKERKKEEEQESEKEEKEKENTFQSNYTHTHTHTHTRALVRTPTHARMHNLARALHAMHIPCKLRPIDLWVRHILKNRVSPH